MHLSMADLQKHYRNLEALALDKDVPEDIEDVTGACDAGIGHTRISNMFLCCCV